ncbi:MAG: ABC transporter ATP-binding protein [Desulfobacteraceae bacterium]|nr:ABC transporter ATP-binding protein [Desulfobacteraceae bacterium]
MNSALIEFRDVHKAFGANAVLKGVDLSIYAGEISTIIGKSGIGKSVLLKHIIGLLAPDSGQIFFDNVALDRMSGVQRKAMKITCSYMFQGTALFDSMTVYENIALPLREHRKYPAKEIRSRVREKMAQLDIAGIENSYPSQLSGGTKKRVAMARALITEPRVVLFDEPTTGLDPIRKAAAHQMIVDYQKQFGFTAIMVSHEIPDVFFISQRIAMLDEGRIIFQGACKEIQTSQHPAVREFLDSAARANGLCPESGKRNGGSDATR